MCGDDIFFNQRRWKLNNKTHFLSYLSDHSEIEHRHATICNDKPIRGNFLAELLIEKTKFWAKTPVHAAKRASSFEKYTKYQTLDHHQQQNPDLQLDSESYHDDKGHVESHSRMEYQCN